MKIITSTYQVPDKHGYVQASSISQYVFVEGTIFVNKYIQWWHFLFTEYNNDDKSHSMTTMT